MSPTRVLAQGFALAAIIAVAVFIIYTLTTFKPEPPSRPVIVPKVPVDVITTKPQRYRIAMPSQGLVEATTQATLAAQVAGNIISISPYFDVGGAFKKGDVLVSIDPADYIAALRLAESNLKQAQVAVEQEEARARQAEKDWRRLGNGGRPPALVKREPQLIAAKAQFEAAQAQLEQAQLDMNRTDVVAPFSGRVIAQSADVGSYVGRGQALGLIFEADRFEVKLPLSSSWRQFLDSNANTVDFTLDLNGNEVTWQGEVLRYGADVSQGSRQFVVVAGIDASSASIANTALFVGDFVSATLSGRALDDVHVLPRTAVYNDSYIWLVENDRLSKQNIHIVWANTSEVVVDTALREDALVVVTPLGNMVSGAAIRIARRDGIEATVQKAGVER